MVYLDSLLAVLLYVHGVFLRGYTFFMSSVQGLRKPAVALPTKHNTVSRQQRHWKHFCCSFDSGIFRLSALGSNVSIEPKIGKADRRSLVHSRECTICFEDMSDLQPGVVQYFVAYHATGDGIAIVLVNQCYRRCYSVVGAVVGRLSSYCPTNVRVLSAVARKTME